MPLLCCCGLPQAGYLFPEIGRRRNAYLEANPDAQPIISLGIGDTTMPVPKHILSGLVEGSSKLGTKEGYSGYGNEAGQQSLREKISENLYDNSIDPSEVFVSDGSKCDIGRLQMMFGAGTTTAVQDPSYPVYVDTSVIMGQTGEMDQGKKQYDNIVYMVRGPSCLNKSLLEQISTRPRLCGKLSCRPRCRLDCRPSRAIPPGGGTVTAAIHRRLLCSASASSVSHDTSRDDPAALLRASAVQPVQRLLPRPRQHAQGRRHLLLLTQQPDRRRCLEGAAHEARQVGQRQRLDHRLRRGVRALHPLA